MHLPLLQATQLLSIPQSAKADLVPKLPWPDGSLLSAKLMTGGSEGFAILSLGMYRMQVKVPPNTPMGHIWMQLIHREMPFQIRILNDAKAAALLSEMLSQHQKKDIGSDAQHRPARQAVEAWHKVDMDNLPFRIDMEVDGQRMMLKDRDDDSPKGVLNSQQATEYFRLHGRVDLEHAGALAFTLEGKQEQPWRMRLYIDSNHDVKDFKSEFVTWLQSQHDLRGEVVAGLPEAFGELTDIHA